MKKPAKIVLGFVSALGLTALAVFFTPLGDAPLSIIFSVGKIPSTDFKTLTLGSNPNQYLVCPENYCGAKPHGISPVYSLPPQDLQKAWESMLATQPNISHLSKSVDQQQMDLMQRTKLVRYPDVITVRFIALNDSQSTLAVYSRSLYGRSDFDVNKTRIDDWLEALASTLKNQN